MDSATIIYLTSFLEPVLCIAALYFLVHSGQARSFRFLQAFLLIRLASLVIAWPLMHHMVHVSDRAAYHFYFYLYWLTFACESLIGLGMVYDIYKLAMAPLRGLQVLGMIMFRWAAGIATALALGLAFGPHTNGVGFVTRSITQLQQTDGILTLCLMLFVTLAIRPMGLSLRSRIFGVSLGLGILATVHLVGAAWVTHAQSMVSTYTVVDGIATLATFCIWAVYFALPEPKRRMIVLPTTSPFLRWNQISIALGDSPGFVAIAGIDPAMIAPAELEIMRRASLKMGRAAV